MDVINDSDGDGETDMVDEVEDNINNSVEPMFELTEEDLILFANSHKNAHEHVHGEHAVVIGQSVNVFQVITRPTQFHNDNVMIAVGDEYQKLAVGQKQMDELLVDKCNNGELPSEEREEDIGDVSRMTDEEQNTLGDVSPNSSDELSSEMLSMLNVEDLQSEQRRVYNIVDQHLRRTMGTCMNWKSL